MTDASVERAFSICGYCFQPIAEDQEALMTGAVVETAEGTRPDEFAGNGVEIWKGEDFVVAVVPEEGAEVLEEEGGNLLMLVCSEDCARGLEAFFAIPAAVDVRWLSEEAFGSG